MHAMTERALSAISGSRVGERVVAHVWYDGQVIYQDLPLSDWQRGSVAARQVRTQVSVTVTDVDGVLAPWGVDDPLGVGGARLQLIYQLTENDSVDLGFYRIVNTDPAENWTLKNGSVWVSGGALIPVQADDLTTIAVTDRLLASESPKAGATVLSEVRRLLNGIMPVYVAPGVVDKPVPLTTVYERERMDAVDDLLGMIGCTHRMTGDGQLEVYSPATSTPVWDVAGGEDGVMISVQRSQTYSKLYNGAVSEGATPDGRQLIGRAFELSGPLRWEGPHGRNPVFHSATGILTTQAAVDADSKSILAGQLRGRTVDLRVTCLLHPGIQPGDRVRIISPTVTGSDIELVGTVVEFNMRGSTSGVSPMTMTVECSYEEVQAVAAFIRRSS